MRGTQESGTTEAWGRGLRPRMTGLVPFNKPGDWVPQGTVTTLHETSQQHDGALCAAF